MNTQRYFPQEKKTKNLQRQKNNLFCIGFTIWETRWNDSNNSNSPLYKTFFLFDFLWNFCSSISSSTIKMTYEFSGDVICIFIHNTLLSQKQAYNLCVISCCHSKKKNIFFPLSNHFVFHVDSKKKKALEVWEISSTLQNVYMLLKYSFPDFFFCNKGLRKIWNRRVAVLSFRK